MRRRWTWCCERQGRRHKHPHPATPDRGEEGAKAREPAFLASSATADIDIITYVSTTTPSVVATATFDADPGYPLIRGMFYDVEVRSKANDGSFLQVAALPSSSSL